MKNSGFNAANVLLVDDCEDDIELVTLAIARAKLIIDLNVARDGEEAMDYLLKQKGYSEARTPDLVLLDINMPRMNGFEVLEQIKSNADLKKIPVVMLTTSREETDIIKSYNQHANCYLQKPLNFHSFVKMIEQFDHFWFSFVTLPRDITPQQFQVF